MQSGTDLVHVCDALKGEFLEVKAVGLVKVRGDGLWVEVHDDRLEAILLELSDARNSAPIKLDAATDAVRPATEYNNSCLACWNSGPSAPG